MQAQNHETNNALNLDESSQAVNADGHGLGASPGGIGHVGEVNGKGDEEVSGFVPTKDELIQLVKYWAKKILDLDFVWFLYQCTGGTESRLKSFALRRINRIAEALGEDEAKKAVQDVMDEYAQTVERADWIVFRYGTHEEAEAVSEAYRIALDERVEPPVAVDELASKILDRIFREGTPQQQEELLKQELRRYATKLFSYRVGGGHIINLFGIDFPCELKPSVLSTGVDDPDPDPHRNTFFKVSVEQGKAILAALDKVASKGEEALRALVSKGSDGRSAL